MKVLMNNEIIAISGGVDLFAAAAMTTIAAITVTAFYCAFKYAPKATPNEDNFLTFHALQNMNSANHNDIGVSSFGF